MTKEVKYGVISDIHQNPNIIVPAIKVLKNLGVQKLIINGDIGERQNTIQESQDYIAVILDTIGKSNLESYVQPGSHESVPIYQPVIEHFEEKYSNIINTLNETKIQSEGHDLVFLPGSDFLCGGDYQIGNNSQIPTGLYLKSENSITPYSHNSQNLLSQVGKLDGYLYYSNMNDLKSKITDPQKTIAVCHIPRKFDSLENAIDMAYFGEKEDGSVMPGFLVEQMIRNQFGNLNDDDIYQIAKRDIGVTLKKENRGNNDLKSLYGQLGITKAISGHFHESGHRAHDSNVNPVKQGDLVDELYWNSGQLDLGQTGILTTKGNQVSYQNILLQNYLK